MLAQHLADLPADGEDGVQRGHRLLEDERDLPTAYAPQLRGGRPQQVDALEERLAGDGGRGRQQAQDRHRADALAAARLADEPEHLPGRQRERDPVDGVRGAAVGVEPHGEIADVEQWLDHQR